MESRKQIFRFTVRDEVAFIFLVFLSLTLVRFLGSVIEPIWFPLLLAYILIPLFIIKKEYRKDIGFMRPDNLSDIFIGSILAILVKVITIMFLFYFFGLTSLNWMYSIALHYKGIPEMPVGIIIVVLIFTIGTPLVEEVFFRMTQVVMSKKYSRVSSLIISAFLFGLCHIDEYIYPFSISGILLRLIPITIYGLVHAWVFHKTRSTYGSMISHIVGNAAEAFILIYFFDLLI